MHLSKFRLSSEDKDSFTIQHPNGKSLKVEKSKLSKSAHDEIQKMARGGKVGYDDGGDIAPAADFVDTPATDATPIQTVSTGPFEVDPLPQSGPTNATANAPVGTAQNTVQEQQQPPSQPVDPLTAANQQIIAAQQAQQAANIAEAKAIGGQGAAQAKAIQEGIDQINTGPTAQDIVDDNRAKDDQLMAAYQSQKIDPNRYYNSLGTGQKVAAGIALVLGGIGAGLTHQPNAALSIMQDHINRDIAAQQNDQSQAMNLWKMNRQALGTDMAATAATQNQIYTGIKFQIQQAAANSQNAQAMARAQGANALIDQQIAMNRQRMAIMGGSDVPPEKKIPLLVPPNLQKEAFTEAGQARNASANEADIMKNFDQAASDVRFTTGGHPLYSTFVTPPSIKGLTLLGDPLIRDADGRVNEFEKNDWNMNQPKAWDDDSTIAAKRQFIQSFINHKKATPILDGHGINTSTFNTLGAQGVQNYKPGDIVIDKNGNKRVVQ